MIPSTIAEIRDALKARIESSKHFDSDLETVEWENTFQMVLLLHIYDGLDIIDTRIRTIEQLLTSSHALNSHAIWQDAKGEGEAPVS